MTRTLACALPIAAVLGLVAGCADDGDETLLIVNNTVPLEGCVLSGDEGGQVRGSGRLDTTGGVGYLLTPLVKNTVSSDTGTEGQRTAFIQGARVDVRFADPTLFTDEELQQLAASGLTRFEVPLAGTIGPDGSTAPLAFEVVPGGLVSVLSDKLAGPNDRILVLADVVVRARLGGGTTESQTFTYSVEVCTGCWIANLGPCSGLDPSFEPTLSNECNAFQDGGVQCCSVGGGLVCPAFPSGGQ